MPAETSSRIVGPNGNTLLGSRLRRKSSLLAEIHYPVPAFDRGTGRAANAVARCVVSPAGVAVSSATPWAIKVVGPHSVPGARLNIGCPRSVATRDIDALLRLGLY